MNSLKPEEVLKFLNFIHDLKHLPRRGWPLCNVENHEQIAGHMYAMGIMTFLLGNNSQLDRLKCLQLALVHDLAEAVVGDITPYDNIPVDKKHEMEDEAMKKITSHLGNEAGAIIYNLYKEYESKSTPEARFVKDLDRFDLVFTAAQYEKRDKEPRKCQELFDTVKDKFEHPLVKNLVQTLEAQRNGCKETGLYEENNGLNYQGILKFLSYVHDIKHTPRRGWAFRDVKVYEQVAAHMYAMGMATFILGDHSELDRQKCLQLALVHDLAEAIVGDIIPNDNIQVEVKHKMEDEAMKEITSHLRHEVGALIYNHYKEYEAKQTPEAQFVKDLDSFDLLLTADKYEKRDNTPKKFECFFDALKGTIKYPFMQELYQILVTRRSG